MIPELNIPLRHREEMVPRIRPAQRPRRVVDVEEREYIPASCGNCGACDCVALGTDGSARCRECGTRFSLRHGEPLHARG